MNVHCCALSFVGPLPFVPAQPPWRSGFPSTPRVQGTQLLYSNSLFALGSHEGWEVVVAAIFNVNDPVTRTGDVIFTSKFVLGSAWVESTLTQTRTACGDKYCTSQPLIIYSVVCIGQFRGSGDNTIYDSPTAAYILYSSDSQLHVFRFYMPLNSYHNILHQQVCVSRPYHTHTSAPIHTQKLVTGSIFYR